MTNVSPTTETEFVLYEDTAPPAPVHRNEVNPGLLARLGRESAYTLTAFPIALASFILTVVLVSLGAGLAVLWVGLPIAIAGLMGARGFAHVERVRLSKLDGSPIPLHRYTAAKPGASWFRRMLSQLTDPQSWFDVLWALVGLVTGTIAWSVALTWWAGAVGGLTYWFWEHWLPVDQPGNQGLAELIGLGTGRFVEGVMNTVFGIVFALSLPWVVHWAASMNAGVSDLLLNSRAKLRGELVVERQSRVEHQQAEADALRRLERDIHDGPQQRLVRLGMDLGRAKKQLATDPERATQTLDEALAQARETVDELRSLTRGIAPPLLVDRGLTVALDELVNRSVIPMQLVVELPEDLPAQIETACYFTVSEALTNIAKHSGASEGAVRVRAGEDEVQVVVVDNGVGGAHESKGSGLAGLGSRVRGVGGTLEITSPVGGPTILQALIPLS